MNITATNSPYQQQITAANNVKSGNANLPTALDKFNIEISEHNNSFLHTPQVRPAGFADLGKPNPNSESSNRIPTPEGRGGKLDISV